MTAEVRVTLFCDHPGCLSYLPTGVARVRPARAAAIAVTGWTTRRSRDYCPDHPYSPAPAGQTIPHTRKEEP